MSTVIKHDLGIYKEIGYIRRPGGPTRPYPGEIRTATNSDE